MLHDPALADRLGLNKAQLQAFLSIADGASYRKGHVLFEPNTVCNRLGYIRKGALRTYCINNQGEEISFLLQVNGDFFGDYESYITRKRSGFIIEAILDTEVLFFNKTDLDELTGSDPSWTGFGKTVADICFLEAKRRIEDLLFFNPEERYFNLLERSPEIIRKIPLKYISSYLGITPQSLSRIRKRLIN